MSTVHAEARSLQLPLAVEDQTQLCDALASVVGRRCAAAQAYHHLAATFPDAVKPIHAWLYVRAASRVGHGLRPATRGERDLDLFARTFARPGAGAGVFRATPVEFRRRRIHLSEARRRRRGRPLPGTARPRLSAEWARRSCWLVRRRRRRQGGRRRPWSASRCCCGWRRRAWRGTTGWPACSTAAATWTGRPRCWPAGTASARSITGP